MRQAKPSPKTTPRKAKHAVRRGAKARKSEAVNIRMHEETRALIDRAAELYSKSRSDFMIEAARREAENVLLDQAFVMVGTRTHEKFLALLDKPASGPGYERLMATPLPWARSNQ